MILSARRLKENWYPYMRNLPLEISLLTGHSAYTKFIVLGRSRVGSNFLRGLLNSHPQITTYGEIFRDIDSSDWDHLGYFQSAKMIDLLRNDPVKFLQTKLFGKYPRSIAAVGFKIFYYHAHNNGEAPVWSFLQDRKDVRVIHLKRRNILKTHLSRQKAAVTDSWVNTSRSKEVQPAIRLDYEACLQDFNQTRAWEEEYDRLFAHHPKIEVIYEELAGNYQAEMARLQEFLGVDIEPVAPTTYQQSSQPLAQAIANYAELKEQFADTPWAEFFTD